MKCDMPFAHSGVRGAHTAVVVVALAAWLAIGLTAATASEASFQGLGDLPGGLFESVAHGVSADGSVVVGRSSSASSYPNYSEAFRWTQAGGMVGLGDLPGGGFRSYAYGVSADGSVVVGYGKPLLGREAFRWTQAGGMVGLGTLPGGYSSYAYGVSADGSVVVGFSESASHNEAFRWTQAGGMVGLGDLPGGSFYSYANGVSADGSVVVGHSGSASGCEAFRWTQAGGMVGLGDLPGGDFDSEAYGVSADGSVVVGDSDTASGEEAFIWTEDTGMVSLRDLLVNTYGLDLTGWTLAHAEDISADGKTIVGYGANPSGQTEAWIAHLGPAWTVLVFLNGDNNLEGAGVDDFLEMAGVGPSDDLNIIVQFDRIPGYDTQYGNWTDTRRFQIQLGDDPAVTPVQNLGEVNMGDSASLVDFAVWGITNYPAAHYLLVIWNHGGGWGPRGERGASWDDTNGSDFFTTNEVRDALATITTQTGANVDILGFDACLMQMVETAYSVRESCDYVVGSEELEPGDGWAYDVFLGAMQPDSTPEDVCVEIVNAYQAQGLGYATQSAFATSNGIGQVAGKVDLLAAALIANMPTEAVNIGLARQNAGLVTFDYDGNGTENSDSYVDIGHLCQMLETECQAQDIKDAANDVRSALVGARIANATNGTYYAPAEGLSIYFPDHQPDMEGGDDYYANYQNIGGTPADLDFVADTQWDEFLKLYCEPAIFVVSLDALDDVAIKDISDPVWQQDFDADCNLVWGSPPVDHPIAVSLKRGKLRIGATLDQCPAKESWTPKVKYKYEVWLNGGSTAETTGNGEFTGWDGTFEVVPPRQVNDATLKLTFKIYKTIGGKNILIREQNIDDRLLYIVLDEPTATVKPPKNIWLEKATAWARTAKDDDDAMEKLLNSNGIYGQSGWLYRPGATSWTALVEETATEGNSVSFSNVWNGLSGVLGIPTTGTQQTGGSHNMGFVTTPVTSLDGLEGNAHPPSGSVDRWRFGMHQVGTGAGKFYDPTFGQTYTGIHDFIEWHANGYIFSPSPPPAIVGYSLTGGGEIYQLSSAPPWGDWEYASTPKAPAPPLRDGSAAFTGVFDELPVDDDADGRFETLTVTAEVSVSVAGDFTVTGSLWSGTEIITVRASVNNMLPTTDWFSADPGLVTAELAFSGEDIRNAGYAGPYTVSLALLDDAGTLLDTAAFDTTAYAASDFGSYPAEIISTTDYGDDIDGDSLYDFLVVNVNIEAYQEMDYGVAGTLLVEDTVVATADGVGHLPVGAGSVDVSFDGRKINGAMIDGPYTLNLLLYNADAEQIDMGTSGTNPYTYLEFDPAAVSLTGPFDDHGEDVNSNGLFEFLVFEAAVDVSEAGDYDVLAWLENGLEEEITWAQTDATLAIGTQLLTLRFDGVDISRHGTDGPFVVFYVVVTADDGTIITSATDLHTTAAYGYGDFERSSDLDGDGDVDLDDFNIFVGCLGGPDNVYTTGCDDADLDIDNDVDLRDFAVFQSAFAGNGG